MKTHSTNPSQAIHHKALQDIARVDRVDYVGYILSLFLPPIPPLRPQLSIYLPQKFFQNFYKAGRLISPLDLSPSYPPLAKSGTL